MAGEITVARERGASPINGVSRRTRAYGSYRVGENGIDTSENLRAAVTFRAMDLERSYGFDRRRSNGFFGSEPITRNLNRIRKAQSNMLNRL